MLSIRTTGTCRSAALAVLAALALSSAPAAAQPVPAGARFPVTPRAAVPLDAAPLGAPAVTGGRVFVAFEAGRLAAYRASDGAALWRVDLAVVHPPVALDDLVLTVADGAVRALSARDGRETWRFETRALAVPLLAHEGWIIVSAARHLAALRATDGSVVWARENPTLVARPTIEGNRLYAPLADGRIQALDLSTGTERWTTGLGGPPTTALAFPDRLYAGSGDQHFYCLDAVTGAIHWRFPVRSPLRGSPAAHGSQVFTVALDNVVRAHDRRNGHRTWNKGIPYRALTGPIVAGGTLAVPGPSAELLLFDAGSGQPQPALPFDSPLVAPVTLGADGHHAVLAALTGSFEAGWRLLIFDSSWSVPLAPLTALPGEPVPLWTPGK